MQMFLKDASQELEGKRDRINCRDIVQRTVIALSFGVNKLWYWNLTSRRYAALGPHPVFGKLRLMDEQFKNRYPAFYTYQQMVEKLKDLHSVERVNAISDNIYLFRVNKKTKRCCISSGRKETYSMVRITTHTFEMSLNWQKVKITDVFGKERSDTIKNRKIILEIADTPLFLEPKY